MKAERTARASSTRTPAAVVPAGDVASARSDSGSRPVSASNAAEPRMVSTTSVRLTARVRPICTPASMSASATKKKYAGTRAREAGHRIELVLGQSNDGTRPRKARPQPRPGPADVANEPPDIAATPLPTSAATLGMARMTAGSPPSAISSRWHGTPATMERTRVTPARDTASARHAGLGRVGLDREKDTGQPVAAGLEQVGLGCVQLCAGPGRAPRARRAARPLVRPRPRRLAASTPVPRSPPSRAPPIFPPPTMSRLDTPPTILTLASGR